MLSEAAMIAMLAAADTTSAPALHAPAIETAHHADAMGIGFGAAMMVGGAILFKHGLDTRGYVIHVDQGGGASLDRQSFDAQMGAGLGIGIAGLAILASSTR